MNPYREIAIINNKKTKLSTIWSRIKCRFNRHNIVDDGKTYDMPSKTSYSFSKQLMVELVSAQSFHCLSCQKLFTRNCFAGNNKWYYTRTDLWLKNSYQYDRLVYANKAAEESKEQQKLFDTISHTKMLLVGK